ncbi:hypothetical protein O181_129293 [Austropuccinia psidii MF-1]|uniref:Uncharacterized protein n=1 Tax=Austropuccinia psidii MF-1 TaxID=1389203 RepID=A0A9Q3Q8P3_9BASI|nr:hypothetical protein [Austropuccinia psidii MF-1]
MNIKEAEETSEEPTSKTGSLPPSDQDAEDEREFPHQNTPTSLWFTSFTMDPIKQLNHCTSQISIIGRSTPNLNKNCNQLPGWFDAWQNQAPGSVDPQQEVKIFGAEMIAQKKLILELKIMVHLPFTIFEDKRFQAVLETLAPQFEWPRHKMFAKIAEKLY